VNEDGEVQTLKKELEEKSTELATILNRWLEFEEVAQCIRAGFEEEWGVHFLDIPDESKYPLTIHWEGVGWKSKQ
jgi:hypothetical protein